MLNRRADCVRVFILESADFSIYQLLILRYSTFLGFFLAKQKGYYILNKERLSVYRHIDGSAERGNRSLLYSAPYPVSDFFSFFKAVQVYCQLLN